MSSYHYTPSSVGGRSGGSGSLKSCLRKGNYKYSSSQRSCGATASITTYSSAPQKQQLQYQYNNQQQQARQDEQSSHRSTSSAPCRSTLIGGGSLQQHSSSHQSIISYASSAPTTTRGGHNSSNSNSSYHSVSQHSNSNSVQDDERQFMLTSKQLVEHHQSHTSLNSNSSPHHHSTTQTALSILNIHLPTPSQKIQYYKLLQNNINYLPMFPESNESNSLVIIRYVNRVFGDVLGREVNGGGVIGISGGSVGGSLSGVNNNCVANSQIYPPPSQQQSQQSYLQQQYNLSTNTQPQTEIIAQSMLSPRSAHPQQQQSSASANHRTVVNSSPKQFSRSGYSLDGDNCNPPQPMFAPPSQPSGASNVVANSSSRVPVNQMSLNVPPPIPMNYHHQSSTRERASSIQAQLLSPPPSSGLTQQRQSLPPPNTGCLQLMYHPPQYHNVTFAQSTEDGASTTHSVTSASQSYQMGVAAAGSPLPQPLSFASSSVANKSVTGSYVDSGGLEAVGSITSEGKIDQVIHKIEAILNSPGGGGGNGGGGNSVSTGHDRSTIDRSLIGTFTSSSSSIDDDESLRRKVEQFDIDTSSEANSRRIGQHSIDTSGNSRTSQFSRSHSDSSSTTSHQQQHGIGMKNEYQTFQTIDMLPPLKTRESILYYPPITSEDTCGRGTSLSCCTSSKEVDIGSTKQLTKRPSNYLQLYIKCERSEPYVNQDLDLVTWYRSGGGGSNTNEGGGGKNTANRTLVVKNTTNLEELIIGIMTSFGLSSPEPDNEDVDKEVNVSQDELKRRYEQERNAVDESLSSASSSKTLGCYNDVCFISDIKTTTATSTVGIGESTTKKTTYLTPLPVPGLYYKYIDRPDNGHNPIAVNSKSSNEKKNEHRDKKKGGSSVLSTDPLGFKRTLLGQILDKPIYSSSGREGIRNRLALVYCTPKRQSYVSSRSTQYGTMPETIYHFQILLEGIINEYDLPSSFASQSSIRCVGATGGVLGGSVMDTQYEINDLNRILWKKNGQPQQVIGLPSSSNNHGQEDELEQILSILGVPLFDTNGNQTPKEFVVDRALYNIYSGKLSMEVAQQTQHTLAKLEGTTEWLARRVEDFSQTLTKGAAACEDRVYEQTFGTEYDEDFEAAVSRLEAKTQWVFS